MTMVWAFKVVRFQPRPAAAVWKARPNSLLSLQHQFMRVYLLLFACFLLTHLASAQANDGFQRRDGTMFLVRNGEVRPMPHDVQLPNGRRVTRDGWVERDGRRTELRDGQGCTMLGEAARAEPDSRGRMLLHDAGSATIQVGQLRTGTEFWMGKKGKSKGKGKHKRKHDD